MNKMRLILGDWSDDGHGKSKEILLESNYKVKDIQKAYKNSCKLTGVSFNHNEDYTEKDRDYKDADKYRIACQYEESKISNECLEILKNFIKFSKDDLNYLKNGENYIDIDFYVDLWIKFIKLSLNDLKMKQLNENNDIPVINGYWDKNLNVQFGYGLF